MSVAGVKDVMAAQGKYLLGKKLESAGIRRVPDWVETRLTGGEVEGARRVLLPREG